jgi:hypothetical protein
MKRSILLGTAAILTSLLLPSAGQAASCAQYDPTCQTYATKSTSDVNAKAGGAGFEANRTSDRSYERRSASHTARIERRHVTSGREYSRGYYGGRYDQSGFWPGDVAGGAVGAAAGLAAGAVNTAGAIATAPFRAANAYAYDNSGYGGWGQQSYAERNGFVCTPGTYFQGADGHRHPCQ